MNSARSAPRDGALVPLPHRQMQSWHQMSRGAAEIDVPVLPEPYQTPNYQKASSTVPDVEVPAPRKVRYCLTR